MSAERDTHRGVLVLPGAQAAEEALFEHLDALLAETTPEGLARPVRVVVPSASLRLHVAARVARRRGRAALGLRVQTLYSAALEALERWGEGGGSGRAGSELAFEVLVRREARREPALARRLEPLVDGYGAAAATVRDLLDAGFDPAHGEAAEEALAAAAVPADEVERARALVRAAGRLIAAMEHHGVARRAAVLQRAAERIAADPQRALPSRAVIVHGFADATGVATDLLEAMLRHLPALLLVDVPPVPGSATGTSAGGGEDREEAFSQRFRERLGGAAGEADGAVLAPPVAIERFVADGTDGEAREVALRVRRLLDGGAAPEGVGIVARDPLPHRLALRRHLGALGVPFSSVGIRGGLDPAGRRGQAVLDLLRRRQELPADRWLDATATLPRPDGRRRHAPFVDLRLALSSLGAGRLGDVATLDPRRLADGDWLPLPILRGLKVEEAAEEADAEADGEGRHAEARPARRYVSKEELLGAVAVARRLVARLAGWPPSARPARHLSHLEGLLRDDLGWRPAGPTADPVLTAVAGLAAELPPDLDLTFDELRLVLGRALEEVGRPELGGRGGGVQVLGVVEARGRTFEHLFLVGVHRGAFPRAVRQDPLLGDDLRAALAPVLPDLPRKQAGFDEERFLFAEMLSASPRVCVSWQVRDDEGKALAPSPLAERLAPVAAVATAASPLALVPADGPRPAIENAVVAALHGASRRRLRPLLATALVESRSATGDPLAEHDAAVLAAARVAVLDELDPDLRFPEGRAVATSPGPFLGFVGRRGGAGDPRGRDLWVTRAEALAACPWQHFLERLLALEPTPDPLQALPGTDPLLLGNVVHSVLEAIASAGHNLGEDAATGEALAAAMADGHRAHPAPWPQPDDLERLLLLHSRRVLEEEGIPLPGLARALAERARPYLERAREMDWSPQGDTLAVLAVEAKGSVALAGPGGEPRHLRFKVDRVDLARSGLRLTDYKTGRPLSVLKKPEKRHRDHLARVRQGRALQSVAYLLAARAAGAGEARGRYLYLRPDADPEAAEYAVDAADAAFATAFADTAAVLFAAWDAGSFFPRLVDTAGEKEPSRCQYCRVAEACLRGDSGARRRLHRWASGATAGGEGEGAFLAVWNLADAGGGDPA